MFQNIPAELRNLPQWICWRYEDIGAKKPTKVPYDPKTGKHADVNNPTTWGAFNETIKVVCNYSGVGFVFTDNDPYTFIDLDDTDGDQASLDRQIKIFREFDSYSEISPSGKGLHIIVKGHVPAGRRRSFIEIYSSQRYATFTGNAYPSDHIKPIAERQDVLTQLWEQMAAGAPATYLYQGDAKEVFNDQEIIDKAKAAVNGDKFNTLLLGKWQDLYQSQSEADYAFIDIVAFYTQNLHQITRIFHSSPLGKRDKATKRKDYVRSMVAKSFDRMLPPLDFDGFKTALEAKQLELKLGKAGSSNGKATVFDTVDVGSIPTSASNSNIIIPPGLLGELAQFIYQAAPRPVPEIALAAAIGLMAGITGRAYNISGTGLNQYILLLAATGSGKEAMALGIDRLMNTIRLQVPTSVNFIGPSQIASGQALVKFFSKTSACFVSILGEFGLRLERMSSHNATSAEKMLKEVLLDLYNKSGHGQVYRQSIFADSDKNISATESPAFTILGESTPERFYGVLNEDMISEGLLPRFMLIEYNGIRPPLNPNHLNAVPSFQLIEKLASLVANTELIMHGKRVINIMSTSEATALFNGFDRFADSQINSTNKEVLRQLWNRAHIKALKLSALIAVGVNMSDPIVLPEYVTWAINIVQHDIRALSAKFEAGEIGVNNYEVKQVNEVTRMFKEYVTEPWDKISKYTKQENMYHNKIIPYGYLNKRLAAIAAFRLDRAGATVSMKRAIQTLIDSDLIREASKQDVVNKFGTTQRCFIITNPRILEG